MRGAMVKILLSTVIVGFAYTITLADSSNTGCYVAGYSVSKESVLRNIPKRYIEEAKRKLNIMYCGTSHSSQVVTGLKGLLEYKPGDKETYAVTFDGKKKKGHLTMDYRPQSIFPKWAIDLSRDKVDKEGKTDYYRATIWYLDRNPQCNVVIWSWCSIEGHNVDIYIQNFQDLIDMYRAGGSKGRIKENAVEFVFMTGYARGKNGDDRSAVHSPYNNAKKITEYCVRNKYYCLDYWNQDVYDYENNSYNPYEQGNRNVQHRKFADTHRLKKGWFYCRNWITNEVEWPAHCDEHPDTAQHLTGNIRAYAAWYIFARIAGWNGKHLPN